MANILQQNETGMTIFHTLIHKLYFENDTTYFDQFNSLIDQNTANPQLLINAVNLKDNNGDTIVHYAAIFGLPQIIQKLVSINIRINLDRNDNGETPLFLLVRHFPDHLSEDETKAYKLNSVKLLRIFTSLINFDLNMLLIPTEETDEEFPKMFLSSMIENFPEDLILKSFEILHNCPASIQNPLKLRQVFINSKSHNQSNLIMIAIHERKYYVLKRLLRFGYHDINEINPRYNTTALDKSLLIITNNNEPPYALIELLKVPNLNLNVSVGMPGDTLSHWCVLGRSSYCVDILKRMVRKELLDVTIGSVPGKTGKTFTKLPINNITGTDAYHDFNFYYNFIDNKIRNSTMIPREVKMV